MHNPISKEPANFTTKCYVGATGLDQLEHEWRGLEMQLKPRRFFHSYDWWKSYLTHLEVTPDAVHFFTIRQGDVVIAIFPLKKIREQRSHSTFDIWELPTHRHMNLGDAVIYPGIDAQTALNELVKSLKNNPAWNWNILRCNSVLEEALVINTIKTRARNTVKQITTNNFINTSGGPEAGFQKIPGSFKRNLRRLWKRLEDAGEITIRYVRSPEELPAAVDQFIEIEASGWKGEQGSRGAIKLNGNLIAFYRELSERFSAGHENQINLLELNGTPIAAQYGMRIGDILYLLKIAYSEPHSKLSPGYMLLYRLLTDADNQGIREINFVTGANWNDDWHAEKRPVVSTEIFNTNLKGQLAYAYRHLKEFIIQCRGHIKTRLANTNSEKK